MPLTDDFDATFPSPMSLNVTTPGGAPVTVPIQGIENLTLPQRQRKKDTYTPISGERAGLEQMVLCSESAAEITATLTYEKAHQIAMDAICGTNGCTIQLVGPDSMTISGTGGIERIGVARAEDSRHMTSDITIALSAGWTMTDGGGTTYVQAFNETLVSGAATIDLTACGANDDEDLTGLQLTKMIVTADEDNVGEVTLVEGAINGYAPSDGFSVAVAPGDTATLTFSAAETVDATHKTLDIAGAGSEVVRIYLEAVEP
jgi:hypothetical protein